MSEVNKGTQFSFILDSVDHSLNLSQVRIHSFNSLVLSSNNLDYISSDPVIENKMANYQHGYRKGLMKTPSKNFDWILEKKNKTIHPTLANLL